MGTFREHDAERGEPDLLLACFPSNQALLENRLPAESVRAFESLLWQGSPNHPSPSHVDWGVDAVAESVRKPANAGEYARFGSRPVPWPLEGRGAALEMFVHRVADLPQGLNLVARDAAQSRALQRAITRANKWRTPPDCPRQLELYCLIEGDASEAARQISCPQDIASDSCFSLAMLAEYKGPLEVYGPWFYPPPTGRRG